jgi:antirestriction protein
VFNQDQKSQEVIFNKASAITKATSAEAGTASGIGTNEDASFGGIDGAKMHINGGTISDDDFADAKMVESSNNPDSVKVVPM